MTSKFFVSLLLLGIAACQSMSPLCGTTTPTGPALTMQFTNTMPLQTPPTRTVYGVILTNYWNVVDCKYVMVENIDDNPVQEGAYFYKTLIPTLTVNRVGCMPETTAITRRSFRGYDLVVESPQTSHLATPSTLQKRSVAVASVKNTIFSIAGKQVKDIDPGDSGLTVQAYQYLLQIRTAIFAIDLVNSGLPLNITCAELREAEVMLQLQSSSINADQAGDIVCYAAMNGLFFNTTNGDLLSDLEAIEYAVQVTSGFTTQLQQLCDTVDLSFVGLLGIDGKGIHDLLCSAANSTSSTSSVSSNTGPNVSSTSDVPAATNASSISAQPTATDLNTTSFPNTTTVSATSLPSPANVTGATNTSSISVQPTATGLNMTFFPNTTTLSGLPSPSPANVTGATNTSAAASLTGANATTLANNTSTPSNVAPVPTLITGGTAGTIVASATSAAGVPGPWTNSSTTLSSPPGATATSTENVSTSTNSSEATSGTVAATASTGSAVNSANVTDTTSGTSVETVGSGFSTGSPSGLNTSTGTWHSPPTPTTSLYYAPWSATPNRWFWRN